jgi:hypothetical protein
MIIRHQLLEDPRVPYTKKNGCASILFDPVVGCVDAAETHLEDGVSHQARHTLQIRLLVDRLRGIIIPWCPKASDPGLCVAAAVPQSVVDWGLRCKQQLVTQAEAHKIAADADIHLEGLGGTQDGVIGALAAIGLMATQNDGRVVHRGSAAEDWYDVTSCLTVDEVLRRGVDDIRTIEDEKTVSSGMVDVGKRLRPNYRQGRVVLYVAPRGDAWEAVRVS